MSSEKQHSHNGASVEENLRLNTPANDVGYAPGLSGDFVDPHLKVQRDYESEYAKLSLQGGHKDLLSMSSGESMQNIQTTDEMGRRQRGCGNLSEYNKIALYGGHKDLLKINENSSPTKVKKSLNAARTSGDWYGDGSERNSTENHSNIEIDNINENSSPTKVKESLNAARTSGDWYGDGSERNGTENHSTIEIDNNNTPTPKPTSPVSKNTPTPIRDQRRGNCIVPGGPEEAPKCGKKRFDASSQRREAPFATYD